MYSACSLVRIKKNLKKQSNVKPSQKKSNSGNYRDEYVGTRSAESDQNFRYRSYLHESRPQRARGREQRACSV